MRRNLHARVMDRCRDSYAGGMAHGGPEFQILEGLFERERDGSNQHNHEKVYPDDDAPKTWNDAVARLRKQGFIADSADGLTITEKGRTEYRRIVAERASERSGA